MSVAERVLEIAASTRVLRERRVRALGDAPGGVVLGRELLNLRALAERCASETGVAVRALLGGAALARLVEVCAARSPRFGALVAERPGLAHALAGTLRDLRDAGVPPSALPDDLADLRALYADAERALARLEDQGLFDRIGLFRLAARGARAFVARRGFTSAEVHGATELVGSAGDLVDAVARALGPGKLRFFQPDWGDTHAERLRAEWAWQAFRPEDTQIVDHPALTRGGPIEGDSLRVLRAATPREEVELVASEVLALIEQGVPPYEIHVVARTLEPYAPWLETIFDGYGIPVTSSLTRPLVAAPAARAWLDLVHALTRDLEPSAVVRLLDQATAREVASAAERTARVGAVVRGEADWRAALEIAGGSGLATTLHALFDAQRALAAARSFGAAATAVLGLGDRLLHTSDADTLECRRVLADISRLDAVDAAAGASAPPTPEALAAALEAVLLEPLASWHAEDDGGVRVLDAVQARALPCQHLLLLGVVHGAWPREVREDPFLSDEVRERLRARSRRPVPVRSRVPAEDRFLFGLLLAQATECVTLSWPDVDSAGRALSASALLRDLPFVASGTDVSELASPPLAPADSFARDPGRADPELLRAGRALAATTAASSPDDLRFDGSIGAGLARLPESFTPSFLETMSRCAQRAFFARILRVPELETPSPRELAANEAGTLVHAVLADVLSGLYERGLLRRGTPRGTALDAARELVPGAIKHAAAAAAERVGRPDPALWRAVERQLECAVLDFLARDLDVLLQSGVAELRAETELAFSHGTTEGALRVIGRADRVVVSEAGTVRVGDYKTRRDVAEFVRDSRIKKGLSLQIPLYALALRGEHPGAAIAAEVLAVPLHPERDREEKRLAQREIGPDAAARAEPVLDALAGLLRAGAFPLRADPLIPDEVRNCDFCPYSLACRYTEPATQERLAAAPAHAAYYALRGGES